MTSECSRPVVVVAVVVRLVEGRNDGVRDMLGTATALIWLGQK